MPPVYLVWFLIGLGLGLTELAAPGLILIFFGAGAWVVALITVFVDISLAVQVGIFLGASLVCLLVLRRYARKVFRGEESDLESSDGHAGDLGKLAVVTQAIAPFQPGEIKHRGSFWSAQAEQEIAEGETVVITGRDPQDKMVFLVAPPPRAE